MKWEGTTLLVGQPDYVREIVSRHKDLTLRSSPLPKVVDLVMEGVICPEDVKQCQTVIGELLWLATRTMQAGSQFCSILSQHVLGYLAGTVDLALEYGPRSDAADQYGRVQSMGRLDMLTDSSFAPAGGKGHQGLMAMWGGCLVAWESKSQACATLSTTESELLGYVDGLTMGESVGAVINVLQDNALNREGSYTLRGDSMSGLQLLQAPSGPRRTRHLRLRSHVLRERLRHHLWDGVELCADLLTKSITQQSSWESFRRAVGLRMAVGGACEPVTSPVKKIAYAVMASLGLLAVAPGVASTAKAASLVGLVALAASTACGAFETAKCQSTRRSSASPSKDERRWSRENERDPSRQVHEEELQQAGRFDRRSSSRPLPIWHPSDRALGAMEQQWNALECAEDADCSPRTGK